MESPTGMDTPTVSNVTKQETAAFDQADPIALRWNNIRLTVKISRTESKEILKGISGYAQPGELIAIMGSTGAGKTSLLSVLSQRAEGHVSGSITVNGKELANRFKQAGFVNQDDNLFPMLTVRETLHTRALLTMPRTVTREEKIAKAERLISALGLATCADTRVGNAQFRGVSGGERRRVAIAEVLITNPGLIFLDEPTSGLDAATSLSVMETLRALARAGRTIVCTIHQPRADIYSKFDKLMLLAQGSVVYFGNSSDAIQYFASLRPVPFPCPVTSNPADFFLDLITVVGRDDKVLAQQRIDYLIECHKRVAMATVYQSYVDPQRKPISDTWEWQSGFFTQFGLLTQRAWRNYIRQPINSIARFSQTIFLSLIIGLIFLRLPMDQTAPQNRTGVLFFLLLFQCFGGVTAMLTTFPGEKAILRRERAASAYRVSAYFLGKITAEMLFNLLNPIIFGVILYWMCGLNPGVEQFFTFLGFNVALAYVATSQGLLFSAIAPSVQASQIMGPMSQILLMLFAGFIINAGNYPVYLGWIQYISHIKWSFEALVVTEFQGATFSCTTAQLINGTTCPIATGNGFLSVLNFSAVDRRVNIAVLCAMLVGLNLLSYFALLLCVRAPGASKRSAALAEPASSDQSQQPPPASGDKQSTAVATTEADAATEMKTLNDLQLPSEDDEVMQTFAKMLAKGEGGKGAMADLSRGTMSFSAVRPMELVWRNVSFAVNVSRKETKQILYDCSGIARPGEVVAIMGESGAGKTSLLNVLARHAQGIVGGNITINGKVYTEAPRNEIGYVTQDDLLYEFLTVRETLIFSALLRLPKDMARTEKMLKVEQVIDELGLQSCADTRVGNELRRGLSGGERRRLSIAEVLITNPGLIFLDEPTSGLDAATSLSVMETLRALARAGRTIVCTIHQPRSSIFDNFDKLMLLARGYVVYYGDANKSIDYFASLPTPYVCPPYFNPADFFLDLTTAVHDTDKKAAEARVDYLIKAAPTNDIVESSQSTVLKYEAEREAAPQWNATWGMQFYLLLQRSWRNAMRNPQPTFIRTGVTVIMSLVLGLIFLRLGFSQQSVQDRSGLLFMMLMSQAFGGLGSVLESFSKEKIILRRERATHSYMVSAYVLGKMVAELVFDIVFPFVFGVITYWMANLNPSATPFFIFIGLMMLCALMGTSLGYFISAIAPTPLVASILAPIILTLFSLFGGYYQNASTIPKYFIWLQYLSFLKYTFESLAVNEFTGEVFTCTLAEQLPNGQCLVSTGADAIARLDFQTVSIGQNVAILCGMVVGWRVITYVLLRIFAKPNYSVIQASAKADSVAVDVAAPLTTQA